MGPVDAVQQLVLDQLEPKVVFPGLVDQDLPRVLPRYDEAPVGCLVRAARGVVDVPVVGPDLSPCLD